MRAEFDSTELARRLGALPEAPTQIKVQGRTTLRAYYGSLETSFLYYRQVVARPEVLTVAGLKVRKSPLRISTPSP